MKKIVIPTLLLFVFFVTGCKKNNPEFVTEELAEQKNQKNGWVHGGHCDYEAAYSKAISNEGTEEVPLFQKYYSGSRLQKIKVHFRNVAGGAYEPFVLKVVYQPKRMIFLREGNGDTTAILDFNHSGKLVRARAPIPFHQGWSFQTSFRFFYYQGKLKKIESGHLELTESQEYETVWFPYINIDYDFKKKNVSRVTFPAFGSTTGESIKYWYDYSRKAKAQVYPDDMAGDYHYFFYFLKYLNIFPELTPENILTRSLQVTEYPGTFDRRYADHQFDASGKLISYKENDDLWKIDWKCFGGNNHQFFQQ